MPATIQPGSVDTDGSCYQHLHPLCKTGPFQRSDVRPDPGHRTKTDGSARWHIQNSRRDGRFHRGGAQVGETGQPAFSGMKSFKRQTNLKVGIFPSTMPTYKTPY